MRNKKKKKGFTLFKKRIKVTNISPTAKEVVAGGRKITIYKCGKETVGYEKEKVVYNSLIDEELFQDWYQKFRGFN